MSLPDPPLHMKPGSPEFIQWMYAVVEQAEYAVQLAAATWGYGYSIYNSKTCCITTTESSAIATTSVQWEDGANTCIEYYAGEWQATPGEHEVTIRLKRDGSTIDTITISNALSSTDGGVGFYIDANTDSSSHTYTLTVQRGAVNDGSNVYLEGAGIMAIQR